MTALKSVIKAMELGLEGMEALGGGNLIKKSIEAHIRLAKGHLEMEKAQLDAEYQKGYDKGNYDASTMNQYE